MKFLLAAVTALFLTFLTQGNAADADNLSKRFKKGSHANSFSKRFKKGSYDFGAQIGGGLYFRYAN